MDKQSKESRNRIDPIIALIMEEARTVKYLNKVERIQHVLMKVYNRVHEIMRTME